LHEFVAAPRNTPTQKTGNGLNQGWTRRKQKSRNDHGSKELKDSAASVPRRSKQAAAERL
jgi:hypothetical protein